MSTDRPDDRADDQIEAVLAELWELGGPFFVKALSEEPSRARNRAVEQAIEKLHAAGLLSTPADQDNAIWALADRANFYQRAWESMRGRLGHEMDLRKRAEVERDLLRAQVAAVRDLADQWERIDSTPAQWAVARLRAALDTAGDQP